MFMSTDHLPQTTEARPQRKRKSNAGRPANTPGTKPEKLAILAYPGTGSAIRAKAKELSLTPAQLLKQLFL